MSCLDAEEKGVSILWTPSGEQRKIMAIDRMAVSCLASAMIAVQAKMVLPLKRVCRNVSPLKENENNSITTNDGIPSVR